MHVCVCVHVCVCMCVYMCACVCVYMCIVIFIVKVAHTTQPIKLNS